MPTALVTGGLGTFGSRAVRSLATDDWAVACIDQVPPPTPEAAPECVTFYTVDLTDRGDALELIRSVDPDVVVHTAAMLDPPYNAVLLESNVTSTTNACLGAGRAGADIVAISSTSALGTSKAERPWLPEYLPVDEAHECRPEDPYGTSKLVGEEVVAMVARRHDVSAVSLRPSWLQIPGEYPVLDLQDREVGRNGLFWTYLDVRDAVAGVRAAMRVDSGGHEACYLVADDNCMGRPTKDLVAEGYGELPDQCDLSDEAPGFSNAKAQELLGWEPEHSWRTAAEESANTPGFVQS